ncbi:hypothetical protein LXA47_31390 [Massilia sp. P8910]|uniref:hypothetical protein n=1 Tax=Massilia antarctica TaxID=2765360 RepID=UPI001E5BB231|nr:hypothetical protein [Massilia antarctica]MCE3608076.1 hypothetical protein [Massilia antarctica]
MSANHTRSEIDGMTMAQCRLHLEKAAKRKRRDQVMLAQAIVACAMNKDAWKKITEGL